jgi:hypothetical protein
VTDLAGTQISNLLETLPGIAQVLRSPVADAFVNVIRAATGEGPFNFADADEILKYAVRRNLMAVEESERVLAEAKLAAGTQTAAAKARPAKVATPKPQVAPRKPPKVAKPARAKAVVKKGNKKAAKKTAKKPVKKVVKKAVKPVRKPAPKKSVRKAPPRKKAVAKK